MRAAHAVGSARKTSSPRKLTDSVHEEQREVILESRRETDRKRGRERERYRLPRLQ